MADPFDYLESRDDADELIADFSGGTTSNATLVRVVNSGSAIEPTQTPTSYATYATRIAFTWKQLQRGDVQASDQRWIIAAGPLAALGVTDIRPGDTLQVAGVTYTITPVDPLDPSGVLPVLFDVKAAV